MKLPRYPQKGKYVKDWAREVTDYLKSITITSVVGGKLSRRSGGTTINVTPGAGSATAEALPWKVVANGDNTVTVGFGRVLTRAPGTSPSESIGYPIVGGYIDHAEESVEITETGTLYIVATPYANRVAEYNLVVGFYYTELITASAIEVQLNPSTSSGEFMLIPIATVTLEGDVATVDEQILTHNPDPSFFNMEINDTP